MMHIVFETEFGNQVVFDRVLGKLRICYWDADGDDFEVIMVPDEAEDALRAALAQPRTTEVEGGRD